MAEAKSQTHGHCKEQRRCLAIGKIFYIVGSLSLLSIITIVLEIAFYVYFHWIL